MRAWTFRAVFYPVALGLLAYLLMGNPIGEAKEAPYWTLRGTTDQGEEIKLRLDAHARVRTFDVRVDLYCEGGGISNTGWHPSEGSAVPALCAEWPTDGAPSGYRPHHSGRGRHRHRLQP